MSITKCMERGLAALACRLHVSHIKGGNENSEAQASVRLVDRHGRDNAGHTGQHTCISCWQETRTSVMGTNVLGRQDGTVLGIIIASGRRLALVLLGWVGKGGASLSTHGLIILVGMGS